MKKCTLFLLMALLGSRFMQAQSREERALLFLKHMERHQFDSCYARFDTVLSNRISAQMMSEMWSKFQQYFGSYKGYSSIITEKKDTLEKVVILCEFDRMKLDLTQVFNSSDKLVGLTFTMPKNKKAYDYPSYSKLNTFSETKFTVKSGSYNLPGALCLPNQTVNPPIVILLAGSGPQDKDESVGPNKILKDIAGGLGSCGIGSLRFDKRTLTYQSEMAKLEKIGIYEEVIEDAINAVKQLKHSPETKNSKLFILGHSLGGMCAPVVAKEIKSLSGVILMAANSRPLEDLVLEQFTYLFSADSLDRTEKNELDTLKKQIAIVKNETRLKTAKAEDLPLNLSAYYWQSLNKYNQVACAKQLKQPMLILQGLRDYQVTEVDFKIWQEKLGSDAKHTFISYPQLNHVFFSGTGKSLPAEYDIQGNVDAQVINDLCKWIKGKANE